MNRFYMRLSTGFTISNDQKETAAHEDIQLRKYFKFGRVLTPYIHGRWSLSIISQKKCGPIFEISKHGIYSGSESDHDFYNSPGFIFNTGTNIEITEKVHGV